MQSTINSEQDTELIKDSFSWETSSTGEIKSSGLEKHTDELIALLKKQNWSINDPLRTKIFIQRNKLHELLLVLPDLIKTCFHDCTVKLRVTPTHDTDANELVCIVRTKMSPPAASKALLQLVEEALAYSDMNEFVFDINFIEE